MPFPELEAQAAHALLTAAVAARSNLCSTLHENPLIMTSGCPMKRQLHTRTHGLPNEEATTTRARYIMLSNDETRQGDSTLIGADLEIRMQSASSVRQI